MCSWHRDPMLHKCYTVLFVFSQLAVNHFSRATDTNRESHRVAIEWSNSGAQAISRKPYRNDNNSNRLFGGIYCCRSIL